MIINRGTADTQLWVQSQNSNAGGDVAGSLSPNGSLNKSPAIGSNGVVEMADLAAQGQPPAVRSPSLCLRSAQSNTMCRFSGWQAASAATSCSSVLLLRLGLLHSPVCLARKLLANGCLPCPSQGGAEGHRRTGSLGNLPDMIWQDSLMAPEDVVIQQHPDGSLRQLGNGSFGKVSRLAASHPSPASHPTHPALIRSGTLVALKQANACFLGDAAPNKTAAILTEERRLISGGQSVIPQDW